MEGEGHTKPRLFDKIFCVDYGSLAVVLTIDRPYFCDHPGSGLLIKLEQVFDAWLPSFLVFQGYVNKVAGGESDDTTHGGLFRGRKSEQAGSRPARIEISSYICWP